MGERMPATRDYLPTKGEFDVLADGDVHLAVRALDQHELSPDEAEQHIGNIADAAQKYGLSPEQMDKALATIRNILESELEIGV
ncbi:MAG: hypothetical protein KA604_04400 [Candidatus Saccharimonas sp.]|jgi:hypothetical protein|nr:hypothetical protein [Candidatus Saccharimonas sp.]